MEIQPGSGATGSDESDNVATPIAPTIRSQSADPDAGRIAPQRASPDEAQLDIPTILEDVLLGSDPAVAGLLKQGLDFMEAGNYPEARRLFQTIMQEHPESGLQAPAHFSLALSYYMEGGAQNLALSAGRFADFLVNHKNYQPDVLVEAAQIDLAVVCVELMQSGFSERVKTEAARAAAGSLQTLLERWPDNPQAAVCRATLTQIQEFLAERKSPETEVRRLR